MSNVADVAGIDSSCVSKYPRAPMKAYSPPRVLSRNICLAYQFLCRSLRRNIMLTPRSPRLPTRKLVGVATFATTVAACSSSEYNDAFVASDDFSSAHRMRSSCSDSLASALEDPHLSGRPESDSVRDSARTSRLALSASPPPSTPPLFDQRMRPDRLRPPRPRPFRPHRGS
ncbi:hypothetical protein FKP32DRAFT_458389 [Trametes sanguinea]|nr:hypothetical protein FKP32DRAFT_458389 [Trametes sanguinea]